MAELTLLDLVGVTSLTASFVELLREIEGLNGD